MSMVLTMTGRLEACLLLALSVPAEEVTKLNVPPQLKLLTVDGHAFWNIVVCKIHKMRPLGVPESLGITYHHVAYRLYVTAGTIEGPVSGLYFMHSQADNQLVSWGGNVASDFHFHMARISVHEEMGRLRAEGASYTTPDRDSFVLTGQRQDQGPVPLTGVFTSHHQALKALKYQPFGLAVDKNNGLRIAEVVRDEGAWAEHNFAVENMQFDLLRTLGQHGARLELATWVDPIEYRWRIGRSVPLLNHQVG